MDQPIAPSPEPALPQPKETLITSETTPKKPKLTFIASVVRRILCRSASGMSRCPDECRGSATTQEESAPAQRRGVFVLLGILVILLIGAGTFFIGKSFRKPIIAPQPPIPPQISPIPTPTPDLTADWKTYSNNDYKISFKYPQDFTLEEILVPNGKLLQLIINKNKSGSFLIKASKDYLPGDVLYFFDTASNGQKSLGSYAWKTYYLPKGYGDGPDVSASPLFGLQLEKNNVLYSVTFYSQSGLNDSQTQILSTFKFLD